MFEREFVHDTGQADLLAAQATPARLRFDVRKLAGRPIGGLFFLFCEHRQFPSPAAEGRHRRGQAGAGERRRQAMAGGASAFEANIARMQGASSKPSAKGAPAALAANHAPVPIQHNGRSATVAR